MNIKIFNISIKISIWLLLILIMLIVTNDINNYLLFIGFIFVHELAHIITAKYLNVKLNTFYVLPVGFCAQLDGIDNLSKKQELLITAAGPLINLLIAFIFHTLDINDIAKVNAFLGIFNLLPVEPLDGYKIVKNIVGVKASTRVSYIFTVVLLVIGIILLIYIKNYSLILLMIYVIGFNYYTPKFRLYSFIKELVMTDTKLKNGKTLKTNLLICKKECLVLEVIKQFEIEKYNMLYVLDNNDRVLGIITQSNIISSFKDIDYNTNLEYFINLMI